MRRTNDRGSTLPEALIGLCLIAMLIATLASLLVLARRATSDARRQAVALALARARLEELQGLDFARVALDGGGVAEITDGSTDLSGPAPEVGGSGLASSPPDALERDAEGFADYLDAEGRWLAPDERAHAAYVRRWRIAHEGFGASELAAVDVLVAPALLAARLTAAAAPFDVWLSHPDVVRLSTLRARRAR
jgi:type II secretory pathway pseudopilin PulG